MAPGATCDARAACDVLVGDGLERLLPATFAHRARRSSRRFDTSLSSASKSLGRWFPRSESVRSSRRRRTALPDIRSRRSSLVGTPDPRLRYLPPRARAESLGRAAIRPGNGGGRWFLRPPARGREESLPSFPGATPLAKCGTSQQNSLRDDFRRRAPENRPLCGRPARTSARFSTDDDAFTVALRSCTKASARRSARRLLRVAAHRRNRPPR